ncbi:hypothetical protein [Variovorax boronicumulans]|uniref:hypothetical protein n=1 Tax=Variovorax boronicumulans TaxID=436515 RepID=UPI001C59A984
MGNARFASPCADVATSLGPQAAHKGGAICQADGGEHVARPMGAAMGHARLVRFSRWVSLRNRVRRFLQ